MKVKVLKTFTHNGRKYGKGSVGEVPDELAKSLAPVGGYFEAFEEPKAEEPVKVEVKRSAPVSVEKNHK